MMVIIKNKGRNVDFIIVLDNLQKTVQGDNK